MLLDFLHGKKKILSYKDLTDVIETNIENITSENVEYCIVPFKNKDKSSERYFVNVRHCAFESCVFFIDEKGKRIFVHIFNLLRKGFSIYSDKEITLKKQIGEYDIIDILNTHDLLLRQEEEYALNYITQNYEEVFKNIDDISKNNYSDIYNALYEEYIKGVEYRLPQFINTDCSDFETILEFLDEPINFKEHVLREVVKKLKDTNVLRYCYIYFTVKDMIKNNKIPKDLIWAKQIHNAMEKAGKTIIIYYKDRNGVMTKDKFKNILQYNPCVNIPFVYKVDGSDFIDIHKIIKIEFNRKVLFEK